MTSANADPLVLDAQVHLNLIGPLEAGMAAMDAVGVNAVLIDEWWGYDDAGLRRPHFQLPNGAIRHLFPFASEAAFRYPDRFAYTAWVDRNDPDLEEVIRAIAANPQQVCLRIVMRPENGDDVELENGGFDRLFDTAERHNVPAKIILPRVDQPRRTDLMLPHMRKHEGMQFIVDHCGVLRPSAADQARGMHNPALLEYALAYASLPNVSVMWAKANTLSQEPFPHDDIGRYLRRFIDEFGADRILWGSDSTQTRGKDTWAQSLLYIQASTLITAEEKDWVLGKTAQRILGWPREESPYGDAFDVYEASTWRETEMHLANASLNDRRRR